MVHLHPILMKSDEASEWLRYNRVIQKPIEGIPVLEGVGCSVCPRSAKKRKAIYNHISSAHREDNDRASIVERNVQKLFPSHLKQYIQVRASDEASPEDEGIDDWKFKLSEDFTRLVEENNQI